MTDTVLVTGVSGFLGSHVAAELLRRGFVVRGEGLGRIGDGEWRVRTLRVFQLPLPD
jgi:dihydroflavonol-4-reductase